VDNADMADRRKAACLIGVLLLAAACTNPKDPRLRAREGRAGAVLDAAIRRETRARIRSVGCFRPDSRTEICRVSFYGRRPAERWKLVYTYTSARVRRIG
jgi:hypothetical protein